MNDVLSVSGPDWHAETESVQFHCRLNFFRPENSYRLEADGVVITRKMATFSVRYADVISVNVHPSVLRRLEGGWQHISRCVVKTQNKAHAIQSAHYIGWGQFEDRTEDYQTFMRHFLRDAVRANPALVIFSGAPFGTWLGWLATAVLCAVLGVLGLFILPAGLALTLAGFTGLVQAWTVLQKGYAHPVEPEAIIHDFVERRAGFSRDMRQERGRDR